jgi:hypothetical protein
MQAYGWVFFKMSISNLQGFGTLLSPLKRFGTPNFIQLAVGWYSNSTLAQVFGSELGDCLRMLGL